jgi:C1A family cysteine protease
VALDYLTTGVTQMPKAKLTAAAINATIAENSLGWTAEENYLTQLSEQEQDYRLGYNPSEESGELARQLRESLASAAGRQAAAASTAVGAPPAVDLRSYNGHNYITPVRDQLSCGSCVAFGTIATVEGTMRFVGRNEGLAVDFSEAHLFNCIARSQGRNCNIGWWVDPAMTAFRDQGVVDEACCPYSPADVPCTLCTGWQSRLTKIRSFQELRNTAGMKDWIATKGPLAACFSVYSDFFAYRSGVYRKSPNAVLRGGHCVCVVGFSDALGGWICKNSWGPGWGDRGFFTIAYGECGIDASMWGVEVGAVPPTRTLAPLHRYWNSGIGDHFYTTNWGELGGGRYGWVYEGVQCDISPIAQTGLVPLYRYWNSGAGDHFYTTNWGELGSGKYGWAYEGVQGYVSPTARTGLIPLYRYWNPGIADHFYTTNWGELGSGRYGWGYEGVQCYVWPASATTPAEDVPATFQTGSTFGGVGDGGPGDTGASPPASFTPQESPPSSSFASAPPSAGIDGRSSTPSGTGFGSGASAASFTTAAADDDCGCGKKKGDEVRVRWRRGST